MATYKVLQDIEAEDKILGPLTLKQFIFAIITIVLLFLAFLIGKANWILALPWLLPISFFGFMATPIGRDQPNDVWLAGRIRFLIKPRKRVWSQAGMQELVTINVPKKLELSRTDGLSLTEVKSRLSALSGLMDTRGWAIKDVSLPQLQAAPYGGTDSGSDRLLELSSSNQLPEFGDVAAQDDILDPANNMIAQRIDTAIKKQHSDKLETLKDNLHRGMQEPLTKKENITSPLEVIDYSFINQNQPNTEPGYATFGARVVTPGSSNTPVTPPTFQSDITTQETNELLEKIHHNQELQKEISKSNHEHRIEPQKNVIFQVDKKPELTTAQTAPDAILKQLGQANDISIASIATLAKHAEKEAAFNDNDVVSLH